MEPAEAIAVVYGFLGAVVWIALCCAMALHAKNKKERKDREKRDDTP